jgi:hypothetical protein
MDAEEWRENELESVRLSIFMSGRDVLWILWQG